MHKAAYDFVAQFQTDKVVKVLEIGSRNINGSVRSLFPNAIWSGVDKNGGDGVDIVVDATEYIHDEEVDFVISCESLEHIKNWRKALSNAIKSLKYDGRLIITCSGHGRLPHSGENGGMLFPNEHYRNLSPEEISQYLSTNEMLVEISQKVEYDTQLTAVKKMSEISKETVCVVIPCHNYARYLYECISSVKDQIHTVSQIIVVDDSSDDCPKLVCDKFHGVEYKRCEVRDVHKARYHGLQFVKTKYVSFLDADDKLPPEYFKEAISIFAGDRRIAITYPQLDLFGAAKGPAHGTQMAPSEIDGDNIEQRNWVCAGSVYRTELVHQSRGYCRDINPSVNWSQDWHLAKAVLRSGNWIAKKMKTPLYYRRHSNNMSSRPNDSYWNDADFVNESVTIVIAFSGRLEAWSQLLIWLKSQTWPINLVRLLIVNSTHKPLTASMLGLEHWEGDLQIERIDAGYPELADKERRNQKEIGEMVGVSVASIYNRVITILGTEYVVFIEDDVIPKSDNMIEQMFMTMGPWVAGISGVYRQRYQSNKCCAFDVPYMGDHSFKLLHGVGIERVGGSGFGCLMTRRSVLRKFPLAGDGPDRFFDTALGAEVSRLDNGSWRWILNRNIQANHLINDDLGTK